MQSVLVCGEDCAPLSWEALHMNLSISAGAWLLLLALGLVFRKVVVAGNTWHERFEDFLDEFEWRCRSLPFVRVYILAALAQTGLYCARTITKSVNDVEFLVEVAACAIYAIDFLPSWALAHLEGQAEGLYFMLFKAVVDCLLMPSILCMAVVPQGRKKSWCSLSFLAALHLYEGWGRFMSSKAIYAEVQAWKVTDVAVSTAIMILFAALSVMTLEDLGDPAFLSDFSAEEWNAISALYFVVSTAATVGYGDLAPRSSGGQAFSVLLIFGSFCLTAVAGHRIRKVFALRLSGLGSYRLFGKERHIVITGNLTAEMMQDFVQELFHEDHAADAEELHAVFLVPRGSTVQLSAMLDKDLSHRLGHHLHNIHVFQGSVMDETDLERVCASQAECFFVMPNMLSSTPEKEDPENVIRAKALQLANPEAHIILMLMKAENQQSLLEPGGPNSQEEERLDSPSSHRRPRASHESEESVMNNFLSRLFSQLGRPAALQTRSKACATVRNVHNFAQPSARSMDQCMLHMPLDHETLEGSRLRVEQAVENAQERGVDVTFCDGAQYRFHKLWLRDAARDSAHVSAASGERVLTEVAHRAIAGAVQGHDGVTSWNPGTSVKVGAGGELLTLMFGEEAVLVSASMLRAYADTAGKKLRNPSQNTPCEEDGELRYAWLTPFCGAQDPVSQFSRPAVRPFGGVDRGVGGRCAASIGSLTPSGADPGLVPEWGEFPVFDYGLIAESKAENLRLLRALTEAGAAVVQGVPVPEGLGSASSSAGKNAAGAALLDFAAKRLGGLQRDPSRTEPNWQIEKKTGALSISYKHDLRLDNHTDQSLPSHGIPGVLLCINCVQGSGANTLVDGMKVAEDLRTHDPKAFDLLSSCPNDQERDLQKSRVDAVGDHAQKAVISSEMPIIQLNSEGEVIRIQYNEVFRTPSTVGYERFPEYFAAYAKFAAMVNSLEYERLVPLETGQILLINNWRLLHGRPAGMQSEERVIVGGTVTREAFFSQARCLIEEISGKELHGARLLQ